MAYQQSLFAESSFTEALEELLKTYSDKLQLAPNRLCLDITNPKQLAINLVEVSFPDTTKERTSTICLIEQHGPLYQLLTRPGQVEVAPELRHNLLKSAKNDNWQHLAFENTAEITLILENIIQNFIKSYEVSNSFGCCSRFRECSTLGTCQHPNKLYAKGCFYRFNQLRQ